MRQTLVNVLRDVHTQRIGFTYASAGGARFRISPNDFEAVAAAIDNGAIGVVEGGADPGKARYSIRRDGASQGNTFYIGQNNAAPKVFKSLLVHEAVHAAYDLNRVQMPWLDNEAIAYIAQGFYILSAGEDGGLSNLAFLGLEVARVYQTGANDPFWENELRASLLTDPTYQHYINGNFRGDG